MLNEEVFQKREASKEWVWYEEKQKGDCDPHIEYRVGYALKLFCYANP